MDFSTKNVGTEFCFDELRPEGGSITLRLVPKEVLDRLTKATTHIRKKWRRGQQIEEVDSDDDAFNRMFWDYMIVSWKNVKIDGVELTCDEESKYLAMQKVPEFARFVARCIEQLEDSVGELTPSGEEQLKNLPKRSRSTTSKNQQDSTAINASE